METKPIFDKKFGIFYYENLPESARPATLDDFYEDNQFIEGKWFIIYSFYSKRYECYKSKNGKIWLMMLQFLNANAIYVKNETQ